MGDAEYRDISIAYAPGTPPWPGDTAFSCGWAWAIADGASVNVSQWVTSPHVGTHADAPLHVEVTGAAADAIPLAPFIGPATVLDLSAAKRDVLSLDVLRAAGWRAGTERLLLRTDATVAAGRFPDRWPTLSVDAAAALVADGLRLLGVDAPSVDARESKTLAVHRTLFAGGAYVLENLDLREVAGGTYRLLAPPLKVAGDAAPVRALLQGA
jgi:arylformamidase